MRFDEMDLSPRTREALSRMGYEYATEVQERVIPLMLEGKEVIVRAQTGTGKTAAFGIPLVELIASAKDHRALVLEPTRELVRQVSEELALIGKKHHIKVIPLYGGTSREEDIRTVTRSMSDIIVATPGRLLDLISKGVLKLSSYTLIVIDEADVMLEFGLRTQIHTIVTKTSPYRKVFLFSATMPPDVIAFGTSFMRHPEIVEIGPVKKPTIRHRVVRTTSTHKYHALKHSILRQGGGKIIVFCSMKPVVEAVARRLRKDGIRTEYLHGDLPQSVRNKIIERVRTTPDIVLVSTDVASRGIHIEGVSLVINYDAPLDKRQLIHRMGRTGRLHQQGSAITLVDEKTPQRLVTIRKKIEKKKEAHSTPVSLDTSP